LDDEHLSKVFRTVDQSDPEILEVLVVHAGTLQNFFAGRYDPCVTQAVSIGH
jgi:hypothetical protein